MLSMFTLYVLNYTGNDLVAYERLGNYPGPEAFYLVINYYPFESKPSEYITYDIKFNYFHLSVRDHDFEITDCGGRHALTKFAPWVWTEDSCTYYLPYEHTCDPDTFIKLICKYIHPGVSAHSVSHELINTYFYKLKPINRTGPIASYYKPREGMLDYETPEDIEYLFNRLRLIANICGSPMFNLL